MDRSREEGEGGGLGEEDEGGGGLAKDGVLGVERAVAWTS